MGSGECDPGAAPSSPTSSHMIEEGGDISLDVE